MKEKNSTVYIMLTTINKYKQHVSKSNFVQCFPFCELNFGSVSQNLKGKIFH